MENDSVNAEGVQDSAASVMPDSAAGMQEGTAPAVQMPTPEQLGITVKAGPEGGMPAVVVGDTFEFPVTVSWSVQGSALLVSASLSALSSATQGGR